jgi:hypothetical protein
MSIFPTKILLATDGSSEAELATRTAVDLGQKTDSGDPEGGQGREDTRRRGQPQAGPDKEYEIEQRLDEDTQGDPRTGPRVPARGNLTRVGRTPTLAMPLKRNVRRESRCRRHSMHASAGEVGVLSRVRRVAGMRATKPYPGETPEREELAARAEQVLRKNDMGGWTKAAPELYPHQWSWDSAFIAIGLAHLDTGRAARELLTLFAHQWKTGKVPHIVFNPQAPPESYFPGAEHWACAAASPDAPPAPPYTSCLCQPPVHAIAALRIWEVAKLRGEKAVAEAQGFLQEIYPKLLLWHRYLLTLRDPEGSGLVTIYHPWESGTDNSPGGMRPLRRWRWARCRLTLATILSTSTTLLRGPPTRITTASSGS